MRKKEVEQQTNTQLNWLWVAHYEGYKEGYWTATSNNFFTTDPAKLTKKGTREIMATIISAKDVATFDFENY